MELKSAERWTVVDDANYCGINIGLGKKNIFESYEATDEHKALAHFIAKAVNETERGAGKMSRHLITVQELEDCLNAEAWHLQEG